MLSKVILQAHIDKVETYFFGLIKW
jgi:hypothetical protein